MELLKIENRERFKSKQKSYCADLVIYDFFTTKLTFCVYAETKTNTLHCASERCINQTLHFCSKNNESWVVVDANNFASRFNLCVYRTHSRSNRIRRALSATTSYVRQAVAKLAKVSLSLWVLSYKQMKYSVANCSDSSIWHRKYSVAFVFVGTYCSCCKKKFQQKTWCVK